MLDIAGKVVLDIQGNLYVQWVVNPYSKDFFEVFPVGTVFYVEETKQQAAEIALDDVGWTCVKWYIADESEFFNTYPVGTVFYAADKSTLAPPKRSNLSRDEVREMALSCGLKQHQLHLGTDDDLAEYVYTLVRAIEAAHGIK
jgi:uncharacterized protein (DUF608 family)